MGEYEYFTAEDAEQFSFYRIPKALFKEKEFKDLSTNAKLLYGIFLDRLSLSKKNGWIDRNGHVYIVFTIAELEETLGFTHPTILKILRELDSKKGVGLIERYRQGQNKPSIIYVKNFVRRRGMKEAFYPERKSFTVRNEKNLQSEMKEIYSPDCKKLSTNNTDKSNTERNNTDWSEKCSTVKNVYGRFRNVLLTEQEYRELREYYPSDYQRLIDNLSAYMKSAGKEYYDHFATLCLWANKDGAKRHQDKYMFEEGECL